MGQRIRVAPRCAIDADELEWRFETSGGPGGQHANRSRTRVIVSFDVDASPSLTAAQRRRLRERLGPVVRATADDERSQARNRALALGRLVRRLAGALEEPPPRRPIRPPPGARQARRAEKERRARIKRCRRPPRPEEEE